MMPKPNRYSSRSENTGGYKRTDHVIARLKPNLLTYPDNFITKIVVLFLIAFLFMPVLAMTAYFQDVLLTIFQINIPQLTSYVEFLIIIVMILIIIKLGLDVMDTNNTEYLLTTTHIKIKRGIFRKENITMPYNKIQDVELSQGILEQILGVGDIIIYGGHDNSKIVLDDVPDSKQVQEQIIQQTEKYSPADNYYQQPRGDNYNPQYNQYPEDNRFFYNKQQYNRQEEYDRQYYQNNYNTPYSREDNYQQHNYQPENYNKQYTRQQPGKRYPENNYFKNNDKYDNRNYDPQEDIDNNTLKQKYNKRREDSRRAKREKQEIIDKHDNMFRKYQK